MTEPVIAEKAAPVRGDLTQGPILRTLLLFSIPTLLSNLLQTLNGSVNAMWVGRLIGEDALAATANANIVMFLVFASVFGFGIGMDAGNRPWHSIRVNQRLQGIRPPGFNGHRTANGNANFGLKGVGVDMDTAFGRFIHHIERHHSRSTQA